jgi:hypothetical protein
VRRRPIFFLRHLASPKNDCGQFQSSDDRARSARAPCLRVSLWLRRSGGCGQSGQGQGQGLREGEVERQELPAVRRRLRRRLGRDPAAERRLLKQLKGLGDVGVDIFFREVQLAWDEVYPFADGRALRAAERLGLGKDARALARGRDRRTFARLVAGLVRTELAKDYDGVLEAAAGG